MLLSMCILTFLNVHKRKFAYAVKAINDALLLRDMVGESELEQNLEDE